jgi:uncharacterized protein
MGSDLSKLEWFDWDKGNLEHIEDHQVKRDEVEECFANKPFILNHDETHSQSEHRFRVYGQTNRGGALVIIYTIRNNAIRVVSARGQSKRERQEYKEAGGEKA